jgi:uncharacterized protein (DUF433 family)
MKSYQYITYNKEILGGKPIVKGTRISVDMILEWIASGGTIQEISKTYPQVSEAAVQEALRYASEMAKNEIIIESKVA